VRRNSSAATRAIVTLTGVQPTGDLHLGNYVGAIRPLAELAADTNRDVYVFVADLHALNARPDPSALRERSSGSPPRYSRAVSIGRTCTCTGKAACPPSHSLPRCSATSPPKGYSTAHTPTRRPSPATSPPGATPTTA